MAKKKKEASVDPAPEVVAVETAPAPKKRGRPKGSKNVKVASAAPKKRAGRPKGSRNKPKGTALASVTIKKRGRPAGSGIKPNNGSFRGMVQEMIREEVQKALKEAFSSF